MGIGLHPMEILLVGIVAILLFGQKLPDVLRSLGKSYREFRSGIHELQSQVNLNDITSSSPSYSSNRSGSARSRAYEEYDEPTAPKFEPPPPDGPSDSPPVAPPDAPNESTPRGAG